METTTQAQTLYSRRIPAGMNRNYFIDVRLSEKGNKYLAISESRLSDGTWKSNRINVFTDHLGEWHSSIQEALEQLQEQ